MHIPSILSGYSDTAKTGLRAEPLDRPANSAVGTTAATTAARPAGAADAMREILKEYDVTDISPRGFSEMLQKLHRAGALGDKEYQELSLVRLDLDREGIGANERVNLVELFNRKLKGIQDAPRDLDEDYAAQADREATAGTLSRRLEWLEKFSAIHSSPSPFGVDAVV